MLNNCKNYGIDKFIYLKYSILFGRMRKKSYFCNLKPKILKYEEAAFDTNVYGTTLGSCTAIRFSEHSIEG